jgi:DNA-binding transcriptional ArsR family regulator
MRKNNTLDPNATALEIVRFLIESKGSTIYAIAKALKVPQQKIGYHMPGLEEAGLVLSKEIEGAMIYIPQPMLIDEEFSKVIKRAMDEIYQASGIASVEVCADTEKLEDIAAIVENCTRAMVILSFTE